MKGYIYKVSGGGLNYIGSTIKKLNERLSSHKSDYKSYKKGCKNNITIFSIFDICENPLIECCEIVDVEDRKALRIIEGEWIKKTECVNRCVAGLTRKETLKQYNNKNKETLKESLNKYRQTEKGKNTIKRDNDKRKEAKKEWYLKNRERILEKQKAKYQSLCKTSAN